MPDLESMLEQPDTEEQENENYHAVEALNRIGLVLEDPADLSADAGAKLRRIERLITVPSPNRTWLNRALLARTY